MNVMTRMYRGETTFDFVAMSKKTLIGSAIAIVLSVVVLIVHPLNLSIDFSGGTVIIVENPSELSIDEMRSAVGEVGQEGAKIQLTGEGFIRIQTGALDAAEQDTIVVVVAEAAGVDVNEVTVDAVGPTFGGEVTRRAIQALGIFLVIVAVFISWRFEWRMALAALAALFHDLIITIGVYALLGFVVTPSTVIAVLTILGYSLYDTVVVFDKVNENVHEFHGRATYTDIVNLSMNQVLMRSINTSLTSLIPVGSLLFVGSFALGAHTLREFALALFIGIAIGTYSSLFVAAPLLAWAKEKEPEWERVRRRLDRKGGAPVDDAPDPAPAVPAKAPSSIGATPRAPKHRKKRR
jgi:preprotein translocase subunit SecF